MLLSTIQAAVNNTIDRIWKLYIYSEVGVKFSFPLRSCEHDSKALTLKKMIIFVNQDQSKAIYHVVKCSCSYTAIKKEKGQRSGIDTIKHHT